MSGKDAGGHAKAAHAEHDAFAAGAGRAEPPRRFDHVDHFPAVARRYRRLGDLRR